MNLKQNLNSTEANKENSSTIITQEEVNMKNGYEFFDSADGLLLGTRYLTGELLCLELLDQCYCSLLIFL